MQGFTLYSYFRSSAAYRVRIALHLKGLPFTLVPVHLLHDGGQQHRPDYVQLNPAHLVPTLCDGAGVLTQSLAIMEYLDEQHPQPALLPADPLGRAQVRAMAHTIACDIHPINNLRVQQYLEHTLGADATQRNDWSQHWTQLGLHALESLVTHSGQTGAFCWGNSPTLADCCLVPQLYNARRYALPLEAFPNLLRIEAACQALPAFAAAHPDAQIDAPPATRP